MTGYWTRRRTAAHEEFRQARDLLLDLRLDQEAASIRFRWPRLAEFNWALEWFDVIAEHNDRPALVMLDGNGREREYSFAELSRRSDQVANWLVDLGVERGSRVMIVLGQQVELWETLLACLKIGAVVIPTYTSLTAWEAGDRIRRGEIDHLIAQSGLAGLFDDVAVPGARVSVGDGTAGWADYADSTTADDSYLPDEPTRGDDTAFCYFTSGTTSAPKLVAHTHTSYPVGHLSSLYWNGLLPGDRHLNVSAPGWAKHSWSSFFVPWNAEAAILVLPETPGGRSLPQLLVDHEVTTFCAPPTIWQGIRPELASARPALREVMSAGEPLDPALSSEITQHWGVTVRDGYGQTETTGLIGTTPGDEPRPGWLGRALPGYRISLRDPETGAPARFGEICVELGDRPVGVTVGYLSGGDSAAVTGEYYRTGDLAECDDDGWIRIEGRRDDVFKSFDHRVSPYELEAILREHPSVAQVGVVPREHPIGGAVPHAVVVTAGDAAAGDDLAAELLAHVAARVTDALRVRSIEFRDSLPRTTSGKLRRSALVPQPDGTDARCAV